MENNNPYADLETKYANNINQQNDLLNQSEKIQNEQINANTQQTLAEIERQRGYTQQDFNKEARGAYQDYQKLINPYGVQAENIFSNGLENSGYSETSKLNAYNTYQNRYATARESTDRLMEDFNNQMAQAQLEGNREKAQVALNKLQTQMSNLWQQMNFDSDLAGKKVTYNQWLDEFNYQKQQDEIANAFAREQFEYQKQQDSINNYYKNSSYANPYELGDGNLVEPSGEEGYSAINDYVDKRIGASVIGSTRNNKNKSSAQKNVIPSNVYVSDMANWAYENNWNLK